MEVVRASKVSIWCRLGGAHIYVVVQIPAQRKTEMPFLNHNGIDVETEEEVDECHQLVVRDADKWRIHKITKPQVQHGTYGFLFLRCRRQFLGDPGQSARRIYVDVRARRPGRPGTYEQKVRASDFDYAQNAEGFDGRFAAGLNARSFLPTCDLRRRER